MDELAHRARAISLTYLRNRTAYISLYFGPDEHYIGSAVCIEVNGRLFLATAGHNFEDAERAIEITFCAANRSTRSPLRVLSQRNERWNLGVEPDITWVEIDRDSARQSDLFSVALESISTEALREVSNTFIASGFPAGLVEIAEPARREEGHTLHLLIYVTHALPDAWVEGRDIVLSQGQFAIDHEGQERPMIHPRGMSGGGMWCDTEVGQDLIWSPERIRLIGVRDSFVRTMRSTSY